MLAASAEASSLMPKSVLHFRAYTYAQTGILTHVLRAWSAIAVQAFPIILIGNQIADYLQGEMISSTHLRPRRSSRSAPCLAADGGGSSSAVASRLFPSWFRSDRVDLAATRAFTSVPRRVVAFGPRDAEHLAVGCVDHRRAGGVPGGAARPRLVGVLFGVGQAADANGMLVPPRHRCGFERRACSSGRSPPALRVPGPGQLRLGRRPHRPCLRGIAWRRENAVVALERRAGENFARGDKPLTAAK